MSSSSTIRAAVPRGARDLIAERAPAVDVVAIDDLTRFDGIEFAVPIPYRQADFVDLVDALTDLRVVQTLSAGVDTLADVMPAHVTLCSARGARDASVAEWVLGALLGSTTQLLRDARRGAWASREAVRDLAGSTVLILGMGSIGRAVAARLQAFEVDVVGVAAHAHDGLRAIDELPELLPSADAVVVLTPLDGSTRGLVDGAALARMRDGALLVNAARGPVVDTDALLAETSTGRLNAVLDVTDPEPLPDDHPLWRAPGVLAITPHIAGNSPRSNRFAAQLAGDQLARYARGEPLANVVQRGTS